MAIIGKLGYKIMFRKLEKDGYDWQLGSKKELEKDGKMIDIIRILKRIIEKPKKMEMIKIWFEKKNAFFKI